MAQSGMARYGRYTLVAAIGLWAALLGVVGAPRPVLALALGGRGVGPAPGDARVAVPGGSYIAVTPRHLHALLRHKRFILVNVHVPYAGAIAGTDRFIPFDAIARHLRALPSKTALIVLYCRSGRMGALAARQLVRLGYRAVWNLAGGMEAWRRAGYPLRAQR